MTGDPVRAVVAFLTADGRAARLLAQHCDRGDGHCTACTRSRHVRWPCSAARLALQADKGPVVDRLA